MGGEGVNTNLKAWVRRAVIKRERERQTDRQTDRQTETGRQTDRDW